jgi:hypothetical protein
MPILGIIASSKLQGFSDVYFGLIMGGSEATVANSSVLKWGFTSETTATLSDTLTYASASNSAGVTYQGNRAYKIGGNGTIAAQSYVSKWSYSTGTRTDVSTTMTPRGYAGGISNPSTAGYAAGGEGGNSPFQYFGNFQKVNYSNDALSTVAGGSNITNQPAGANNGSTAGYRFGGDSRNLAKLTFSGESFSTLSGTYDQGYTSCIINGTTAAYSAGGIGQQSGGTTVSTIVKLTFSGESFSTMSATLSTARINVIQVSNRAVNGYFIGGNNSGGDQTVIQKFTYSGETISTLGTSLTNSRANTANADNFQ